MKGINLMEAFADFKELKAIDRETMNGILDDVFRSMILKRWGADDGFDIIINPHQGSPARCRNCCSPWCHCSR